MTNVADYTTLSSAIGQIARVPFFKATDSNGGANRLTDTFYRGGNPVAGTAPGAAATCDYTTPGAIPVPQPTGGGKVRLVGVSLAQVAAGGPGMVVIYDRLVHFSGLSGTVTTPQTVNTPALPRSTDAIGVRAFLETVAALGATGGAVFTASYTNPNGQAGRAAAAERTYGSTTMLANSINRLSVDSGDKGVKSLETVTLSATTGSAGNLGGFLGKVIAMIPYEANSKMITADWMDLGLPDVTGCCLAIAKTDGSASDSGLAGHLDFLIDE